MDLVDEMGLLLLHLVYFIESSVNGLLELCDTLRGDVFLGALCQHLMLEFFVFAHDKYVIGLITDKLKLEVLLLKPFQLILHNNKVLSISMAVLLHKFLIFSASSCLITENYLLCLLDKGLQLFSALIQQLSFLLGDLKRPMK